MNSIVANLVGGVGGGSNVGGDGGEGDGELALVDDAGTVLPIQQHNVDDYSDLSWEPEPVDATGPGESFFALFFLCYSPSSFLLFLL